MKRNLLFVLCLLTFVVSTAFRYSGVLSDCTSVFPDKMNVFYIGVDNPVSVNTPGIEPDKISVVMSGGGMITHTSGKRYIVRVSTGTEATISINYKGGAGTSALGSYKFRVKRVPDPVCYVGSVRAIGKMSKAETGAIAGVFAKMENFDFDLKFSIASYELTSLTDGKYTTLKASGPAITSEMSVVLKAAKSGDRFFFENVTVKGPDGTLRKIPGVTIVVL